MNERNSSYLYIHLIWKITDTFLFPGSDFNCIGEHGHSISNNKDWDTNRDSVVTRIQGKCLEGAVFCHNSVISQFLRNLIEY